MFDWSELLNWTEYSKLFIGLLAMVDPLSAAIIFLGLVGTYTAAERTKVAVITALTFGVTMIVFAFFGTQILGIFGISIAGFQVAGGILLLLMALDMLRSEVDIDSAAAESSTGKFSIAIVPLAIPLLAGPGALSTAVIYTGFHEGISHRVLVSIVIIAVALVTLIIFRLAPLLLSKLGKSGLTVVNRVMGLIVAAIAVEFILDGVASHYSILTSGH